jgi:hypothetical protein
LPKPLANRSINKSLQILAMIIDDAVTYGLHPARTPAVAGS